MMLNRIMKINWAETRQLSEEYIQEMSDLIIQNE